LTPPLDRLFVVNKPKNIGSNRYLSKIKRKYKTKRAGFSGTLDPFADGVLIVAFGKYPKLFQFLKKTPKTYRTTLWLGAWSETLDIEKVSQVEIIKKLDIKDIQKELKNLEGNITYLPPKYSAKKIGGQRAYKLAREGKEVDLKTITSQVSNTKLLHYNHPFVTFELTISEGGYIRSMGEILSNTLKTPAILSSLTRLNEGEFIYEDEKALDPLKYLDLEENFYLNDHQDLLLGRKVQRENFKNQNIGKYFIKLDKMFSILEITEDKVKYLLNGVNYADIGTQRG
jgi:tRNA pseudouridine55 synthase